MNKLNLDEALRKLLKSRKANTQEDLCSELVKLGYDVNQSKMSRLLRKVGAVKVVGQDNRVVYTLPREPSPPTMDTSIRSLILDVVANESLVVVFTSPGSASMVARILDYYQNRCDILGTIAGDDTIFIAPKSVKNITKLTHEIRDLFLFAVEPI